MRRSFFMDPSSGEAVLTTIVGRRPVTKDELRKRVARAMGWSHCLKIPGSKFHKIAAKSPQLIDSLEFWPELVLWCAKGSTNDKAKAAYRRKIAQPGEALGSRGSALKNGRVKDSARLEPNRDR